MSGHPSRRRRAAGRSRAGAVWLALGGDGAAPVATESVERSTLVACIVSPGFVFDDFTLAE